MTDSNPQYYISHSNNGIIQEDITVIVRESLTRISERAFQAVSKTMMFIQIPISVIEIGYGAFEGCSNLKSVNIPDSITQIRSNAFRGCSQLNSVNISDSLRRIESRTFEECSQLSSVVIPNSVTRIDPSAFRSCSNLQSVIIPNSVTVIGDNTFNGCLKLSLISIPNSVVNIGIDVFLGCEALEQKLENGHNYHADTLTWLRRRFDNLILHQVLYEAIGDMTTDTLTNLLQQHKLTLFETDAMDMTPLHVLCGNPTATIEMIQIM